MLVSKSEQELLIQAEESLISLLVSPFEQFGMILFLKLVILGQCAFRIYYRTTSRIKGVS